MALEHRLENPQRVEELSPPQTLKRLGLHQGDTFCDIGAGTGLFTFAAAEQTHSTVYAVEPAPRMLEILEEKKARSGAQNVCILDDVAKVPAGSCEAAMICTVLHELEAPGEMLGEIARILRPGATLAVIEFHYRITPMGGPLEHRISPERVEELAKEHGLVKTNTFELGENFYTLLFKAGS
ncbi:methyltransferase domain-containing protein [Oscillospiraceae bacterium MB08-C2-2]|nr:methyltransferase domain-containing protein [Oscillospiraceae bacterium MB08-C2-2]